MSVIVSINRSLERVITISLYQHWATTELKGGALNISPTASSLKCDFRVTGLC